MITNLPAAMSVNKNLLENTSDWTLTVLKLTTAAVLGLGDA